MALYNKLYALRSSALQLAGQNIAPSRKLLWRESIRGSNWFNLRNLNLNKIEDVGVYMIKNGLQTGRTLYVGQGLISQRLYEHRRTLINIGYRMSSLKVAWANVPRYQRDGVERFLFDYFKPTKGQRAPDVEPIKVNLPRFYTKQIGR